MPIQERPDRGENRVRQNGEKLSDRVRAPAGECFSSFRLGIPIIGQQFSGCAEFLFKSDQALIIEVGTPKVDTLCSRILTFLNKLPEQEWHSTETVKPFV